MPGRRRCRARGSRRPGCVRAGAGEGRETRATVARLRRLAQEGPGRVRVGSRPGVPRRACRRRCVPAVHLCFALWPSHHCTILRAGGTRPARRSCRHGRRGWSSRPSITLRIVAFCNPDCPACSPRTRCRPFRPGSRLAGMALIRSTPQKKLLPKIGYLLCRSHHSRLGWAADPPCFGHRCSYCRRSEPGKPATVPRAGEEA